MLPNLPFYLPALFIATTLLAVYLFYRATNKSTTSLIILLLWLGIQAGISISGFYTITDTVPPRIVLLIAPVLALIILLFTTKSGKKYFDSLDNKWLTWLHIVRIPVEIGLFLLFTYQLIPQAMTFEGRNFDILSGITAPVIAYFGYSVKKIPKTVLLLWNFICLVFVINVVTYGILSVPSVIQQLSFHQPNAAVLYFPFVWLPCCIVPLVIFSHIVCIRQLLKK